MERTTMKITSSNTMNFDFNGRSVRTIHIHGQPWFVGRDVCGVLGIQNVNRALGNLAKGVTEADPLCASKGAHTMSTLTAMGVANDDPLCPLDEDERAILTVETQGGPQSVVCVNESGLYALIFKSRKPDARAFRKWVTNEVLPALRKTGFYSLGIEMMEGRANWELSRCRARMALLRELADLEREPKPDTEYLTVAEFLDRQGIRLENRVE